RYTLVATDRMKTTPQRTPGSLQMPLDQDRRRETVVMSEWWRRECAWAAELGRRCWPGPEGLRRTQLHRSSRPEGRQTQRHTKLALGKSRWRRRRAQHGRTQHR